MSYFFLSTGGIVSFTQDLPTFVFIQDHRAKITNFSFVINFVAQVMIRFRWLFCFPDVIRSSVLNKFETPMEKMTNTAQV